MTSRSKDVPRGHLVHISFLFKLRHVNLYLYYFYTIVVTVNINNAGTGSLLRQSNWILNRIFGLGLKICLAFQTWLAPGSREVAPWPWSPQVRLAKFTWLRRLAKLDQIDFYSRNHAGRNEKHIFRHMLFSDNWAKFCDDKPLSPGFFQI